LVGAEAHQQVFGWVLRRLARGGLMKGKTIGIDSTTLEAQRGNEVDPAAGYAARL
jgi:hypothetical protein